MAGLACRNTRAHSSCASTVPGWMRARAGGGRPALTGAEHERPPLLLGGLDQQRSPRLGVSIFPCSVSCAPRHSRRARRRRVRTCRIRTSSHVAPRRSSKGMPPTRARLPQDALAMPACPTESCSNMRNMDRPVPPQPAPRLLCSPNPHRGLRIGGQDALQTARGRPTGARRPCLFVVLSHPALFVFVSWPRNTVAVVFAPRSSLVLSNLFDCFAHRNSRQRGCHWAVTQEQAATVASWGGMRWLAAVYRTLNRIRAAAVPSNPHANTHASTYPLAVD